MNNKIFATKYYEDIYYYQQVLYLPFKKKGFSPKDGSEIIVKKIPRHSSIYELLVFFQQAGEVFEIRLMLDEIKYYNRGFAFVKFTTPQLAKFAIELLKDKVFKDYAILSIEKSLYKNCRIFVSGFPVNNCKAKVIRELLKNDIKDIADIIMHTAYKSEVENGGFAFLEFHTHEIARSFKTKCTLQPLKLFNCEIKIGWPYPVPESDHVENHAKVIHLQHLNPAEPIEKLERTILMFIEYQRIQRIHKSKDYAFVQFRYRQDAELIYHVLTDYFITSNVEVTWAKSTAPQMRLYSTPRQLRISDDTFSLDNIILSAVQLDVDVSKFIGDIL